MRGLWVGFDAAADFEAVHAWHHDVEQDDIGDLVIHALERIEAVECANNLEVLGREFGFEQFDVRENVVDDQYPRGHDLPKILLCVTR